MLTKGIKSLALLFIFALTICIIPLNVKAADGEEISATIDILPLSVEDEHNNIHINDIDTYKKAVKINILALMKANPDGSYSLNESLGNIVIISNEEINNLGWSLNEQAQIKGERGIRNASVRQGSTGAIVNIHELASLLGIERTFRNKEELASYVSHNKLEVYGICPKKSIKITISNFATEDKVTTITVEEDGKSYDYNNLFGSNSKCTLSGKEGNYFLTKMSAQNDSSEDRVFFLKSKSQTDSSEDKIPYVTELSYSDLTKGNSDNNYGYREYSFAEYYFSSRNVYVKNATKKTKNLQLIISFSGSTEASINSNFYSGSLFTLKNFIAINSSNVGNTFKSMNMLDSMKHFDLEGYRLSSPDYYIGRMMDYGGEIRIERSGPLGTCDLETISTGTKLSAIDDKIIKGFSDRVTGLGSTEDNVIVIDLKSNFIPHTYDVAYDLPSDAVNGTGNPTKTTLYDAFDLKSPSRPGYTFTEWTLNDKKLKQDKQSLLSPTDEAPANNTLTLTAGWTPNTYKIEYEMNGGYFKTTSEDNLVKSYKTGDADISIPTDVEKDGYVFEGWYDNANCKGDVVTKITKGTYGDQHLYAKFTPKIYDIKYELNDGVLPDDAPTTHTALTTVNLKAPTRENYTFIGWFETEDFSDYVVTKILPGRNEDVTLYAKWRLTSEIEAEKEAEEQAKKQKEEEAEKERYDAIEAKEVPVNDVDIKDEDIVNDVSVNEYKAPVKQETPTVKPTTTEEVEKEPTKVVVDTTKVKFVKLKNLKGKKLKVSWKKKKGSYTYEVQYSVKKNFKKSKTVAVTTNKIILKNLKLHKKYYVRVRSVKEVDGVKVYGKWSAKRKIVIRK